MTHAVPPASDPALHPSLKRYLRLALTCHELFDATLLGGKPAERRALDELLRALGQEPQSPAGAEGGPH